MTLFLSPFSVSDYVFLPYSFLPHTLTLPFPLQSPMRDSGPLHVAVPGALWFRISQGDPEVKLGMARTFSK